MLLPLDRFQNEVILFWNQKKTHKIQTSTVQVAYKVFNKNLQQGVLGECSEESYVLEEETGWC